MKQSAICTMHGNDQQTNGGQRNHLLKSIKEESRVFIET